MRKVSVVIPCYNEEHSIGATIKQIPKSIDEIIIVVDKKTTDQTTKIARKLKARVLELGTQGYGANIKTGVHHAIHKIIVIVDGDATYPLCQIPQLLDFLEKNKLDFVSGSRFPLSNPKSMSFSRYSGNKIITFLMGILFLYPFQDGLSGMWIFKKSAFQKMALLSDNWNFSEEIKIEAIRNKTIRFGECHINYEERIGKSKMFPWRVGLENVAFLIYIRIMTLLKINIKGKK